MTKGKAWKAEEELRLRELFDAGNPVSGIAIKLSMSEAPVYSKLKRLGLKDDERTQIDGDILAEAFL